MHGTQELHQFTSIPALLRRWADRAPEAQAVLGVDCPAVDYRGLWSRVERTVGQLHSLGIGRGDRVAMVLPNGPELAMCCFAVACAASSAPLNPAYSEAEFEFFLGDLKPKAIIVADESAATVVARRMGIAIVRLLRGAPGTYELEGAGDDRPRGELAQPDDVALLLHTSGSTSRPKLVPLTQANLCASAMNIARALDLSPADLCLNVMPLFHIHGLIGAVLSSLTAGASVACSPGFLATQFFEWIDHFEPTWYTAVPTMHQAILSRTEQHADTIARARLRFIRSASSALPPQTMAEMERVFGVPMLEAYGMTEASHQMAINPLPPAARKPGSVGKGAGVEIAILDDPGAEVAQGDVGEIAIRGPNVTHGYADNPEANAVSFTAAGWFRTGDRGRLDEDGYLFLTGRSKEIINRGGEKISPREVDEVLADHPAVAAALAFAVPDARLGEDIAAAIVLRAEMSAGADEIREYAAQRLADFKVPRHIVFLDELPKGPTGKPQRIGLAAKLGVTELGVADAPSHQTYLAPRTPAEQALAAIWKTVLGVSRVGVRDDFFALGGDSILATQILSRIRDEFDVQVPMHRLFASPTVEALAVFVDSTARSGTQRIQKSQRSEEIPLSYAQQRMWFLTQLEEATPAYVVPKALRIRGPLKVEALEAAFQKIAERHEVLRTTFPTRGGMPVQNIVADARLPLPVFDCPGIDPAEREETAQSLARVEGAAPMDISRELPIRLRLIRFAADDYVLLVTVHHIAIDGWSKSILYRELENLYSAELHGTAAVLPSLAIQYADYAHFRRTEIEGPDGANLIEYWRKRLEGAPDLLALPGDRLRPARQSFAGGIERARLPLELTNRVRDLSRRESATLYITLLAAFQALLARCSGQTDICVGSPVAYRTRPEVEDLIGTFINTLVMRADLSGNPTFRALLGRVRETALGAFDHQDLPLEKLIEALQPPRSLSYSPLFQVLFQLRNFPEIETRLEGLDVRDVAFDPGTAQFDLTLEITEVEDGLDCVLNYNSALFDRETAVRMLGHYRTLLEGVATEPETALADLPLLTEHERQQLREWGGSDPPPAGELRPNRFDETAEEIAERLRAAGIERGDLVAVSMERSDAMLAALLGIWKAGAAYLPLDPSYPPDRVDYILTDADAAAILTDDGIERLAGHTSRRADGLAYVLYTSGSTGKPKGVAVTREALAILIECMRRHLEIAETDVFLALTTIAFDISAVELFVPLANGARVVIAGREVAANGEELSRLIDSCGATVVQATPSTWRLLIDSGWKGASHGPLKMLCGGEALTRELADELLKYGRVWNGYGPTETTVYSTISECRPGEPVTIGRPIEGTTVCVLDENRQLAPVGVPGELYIGGAGLALGYWGQPELTAQRFIEHVLPHGESVRLYRTGDVVRWLRSGEIEFLGRRDHQVKLRGFRIELEEIEHVLTSHPGVGDAAAQVIEIAPGDRRLAAWFAGTAEASVLRDFAATQLPSYMVPPEITRVDRLPRTPNGKLDREALTAIGRAAPPQAELQPASTMTELLLVQIWEDVLGRRPIGVSDDFFALGGHSLLGARMLAAVEQTFGVRLPLSAFFESPTVLRMAARLGEKARAVSSRVITLRSGKSTPALCILHPSPIFRELTLTMPEGTSILAITVFDGAAVPSPYRLEDIAARQIAALRERQAEGPYVLLGWCADGVLAYEMARQLRAQGAEVPLVAMLDSFNPSRRRADRLSKIGYHARRMLSMSAADAVTYAQERLANRRDMDAMADLPADGSDATHILRYAVRTYDTPPYEGPVLLVRPRVRKADPAKGWTGRARDLRVIDVDGDHHEMLREPNVRKIVEALNDAHHKLEREASA
jgi:amino acid adenylation domain-containing protein